MNILISYFECIDSCLKNDVLQESRSQTINNILNTIILHVLTFPIGKSGWSMNNVSNKPSDLISNNGIRKISRSSHFI